MYLYAVFFLNLRTLGIAILLAVCTACSSKKNVWKAEGTQINQSTLEGLYYKEVGEGTPILLLHGFGASSYSWRHVMEGLQNDYRVIAVDLKGFGKSIKPEDNNYSAYHQAHIISQWIDKLDLHNVTIIGNSFGGGVALASAILDREKKVKRIDRMVLIDSIAYDQSIPFFINLMRIPVIRDISFALFSPKFQVRKTLEKAYYDDSKISEKSIIEYASALQEEAGQKAIFKSAEQLIPDDLELFTERYKSIEIPTLIIWGAHDEVIPLEFGYRLKNDIQNAQLVIIENSGHVPQEESPALTLEAIRSFLFKHN